VKGSIQDRGETTSVQIDESQEIGRGATARVCAVTTPDFRDRLAKLYRDPARINESKLQAMLDNPPSSMLMEDGSVPYPQYAWPTHLVHDAGNQLRGYLMPRIDEHLSLTLDFFYDRDLIALRNLQNECALTFRLTIGRNLCALLADLHRCGHCVIDFKPQNVRVFLRTHSVALLDCDSFRITGKNMRIFPATNYSSEYVAPEGLSNPIGPSALSEGQDRFAVAIVLFQLLNNGIHPFQGRLLNGADAPTTDDKIRQGFYAYGMTAHEVIQALPQSMHACFDGETRRLFDSAFTAANSLDRPSALAWQEHFDRLLTEQQLERCVQRPNDPNHIRFPGMPCGVCHFEGVLSRARQPAPLKQQRVISPPASGVAASGAAAAAGLSIPKERKSVGTGLIVTGWFWLSVWLARSQFSSSPGWLVLLVFVALFAGGLYVIHGLYRKLFRVDMFDS
jgi:DNA-binding helix-hairpin-helix protein with protein kinase domain